MWRERLLGRLMAPYVCDGGQVLPRRSVLRAELLQASWGGDQFQVLLFVESSAGGLTMRLSAPTTQIFVISLIMAILAALAALGTVAFIPIASVWIMAIAYAVLAVGCVIKGA